MKFSLIAANILGVRKFRNFTVILLQEDTSGLRHIDPKTKEVKYNPKYDELFAAKVSIVFSLITYLIDFQQLLCGVSIVIKVDFFCDHHL